MMTAPRSFGLAAPMLSLLTAIALMPASRAAQPAPVVVTTDTPQVPACTCWTR